LLLNFPFLILSSVQQEPADIIPGLINAYQVMGRGWLALAEETAGTIIGFPPKEISKSEND